MAVRATLGCSNPKKSSESLCFNAGGAVSVLPHIAGSLHSALSESEKVDSKTERQKLEIPFFGVFKAFAAVNKRSNV